MTLGIKKSIRTKHKLYKRLIISNFNEDLHIHYRKYRKIVTSILRKAKQEYYSTRLSSNRGNMKETWGVINELIGKTKHKQFITPKQILHNHNGTEEVHTQLKDIVQDFNTFFVQVGEHLANKIPHNDHISFHDFLGKNLPNLFSLSLSHNMMLKELLEILISIKPRDMAISLLN